MGREREIHIVLGASGSGKTTLAKRIVASYPGEVRALDPSGAFEFGEWPGADEKQLQAWLRELTANGEGPSGGGWGPGLLILDDCDRYLTGTSIGRWKDVWLANRHLWLDVLMTAHRPQGIPKDAIGCASELWLFRQKEPRALDYLRSIESLGSLFEANGVSSLPTAPGLAYRVRVHEETVQLVKVF